MNDPTFSSPFAPKSAFFSSLAHRRILAEASARAEDQNPYLALAKATVGAASKVAFESSETLENEGEPDFGTISVIVSSTLTTTKGNLWKSIKSAPDLADFEEPACILDIDEDSERTVSISGSDDSKMDGKKGLANVIDTMNGKGCSDDWTTDDLR